MASSSLLDQQCELAEICNHARTDRWFQLGTQLEISVMDLNSIKRDFAEDDRITALYTLWIRKKGQDATHQKLIDALKSDHVGERNIGEKYEEWLKAKVSTCMNQ